jgi:hypothetical protein
VHNSNAKPASRILHNFEPEDYIEWRNSPEYLKLKAKFEILEKMPQNPDDLGIFIKMKKGAPRIDVVKNPKYLEMGADNSIMYDFINTKTGERIAEIHAISIDCKPVHWHFEPIGPKGEILIDAEELGDLIETFVSN